jgi:hypothetical protein
MEIDGVRNRPSYRKEELAMEPSSVVPTPSALEVHARRRPKGNGLPATKNGPRSKQTRLLALALAMPILAAASSALAVQSHVQASCNGVEIVNQTREDGDVGGAPWVDASAEASKLGLRADISAGSDGPDGRGCDVLATFSNTVEIQPGSSGLSVGAPVKLMATVYVEGELSAVLDGPPDLGGAPANSYVADAMADALFSVTAPLRPVCHTDDGREFCEPAEVLRFLAGGRRNLEGVGPYPPDMVESKSIAYAWYWFTTTDPGDQDQQFQICDWLRGCVAEDPPPPPPPDYRGTRTFLMDAFVGDQLQLDGQLSITADGNYGFGGVSFPVGAGHGLLVSLAPAAGFEGLQLSYELSSTPPVNHKPVCQPGDLQATVGVATQLPAACSDADGDPLTIAIVDQGANGTATVDGQTIVYTPTRVGTDSFTYTASDGTLTSDPVTVTVSTRASLTMTIQSGLVVFAKKADDDQAHFTGKLGVDGQQLSCGSDFSVTLNVTVFAQTVPGSAFQSKSKGKLCVYARKAGGAGAVERVTLDLRKNTFLVKLSKVDLSSLTNPVKPWLEVDGLGTGQTIQMKQGKNRWTYSD